MLTRDQCFMFSPEDYRVHLTNGFEKDFEQQKLLCQVNILDG